MIGTSFLRFNAYKTMVGAVFLRCEIEQIHEGGIGFVPIPKTDNTLLGRFI